MAQKITINIIGKSYKMQVKSASEEHLMRVAADRLNANFKLYDDKFKDVPNWDKLALVSLYDLMSLITAEDERDELRESLSSLSTALGDYIRKIQNNR